MHNDKFYTSQVLGLAGPNITVHLHLLALHP